MRIAKKNNAQVYEHNDLTPSHMINYNYVPLNVQFGINFNIKY